MHLGASRGRVWQTSDHFVDFWVRKLLAGLCFCVQIKQIMFYLLCVQTVVQRLYR
ncbi:hypothetical protein AWT69_003470 [Pseudomonas putida]|nr:hypothetical protein AWT69_003470 [Pseudomonas putida]